jgi:hypothetical protein
MERELQAGTSAIAAEASGAADAWGLLPASHVRKLDAEFFAEVRKRTIALLKNGHDVSLANSSAYYGVSLRSNTSSERKWRASVTSTARRGCLAASTRLWRRL